MKVRGGGKWMDTKRNWHMQVPGFNRGNTIATIEINIAHVENDKRNTYKSQKKQPSFSMGESGRV